MNGFSKNHVDNIKASLNKESLIVSLGAKLRITKLKKVRDWFLNNEVVNFGDPAENLFLSSLLPRRIYRKKEVQPSEMWPSSTVQLLVKEIQGKVKNFHDNLTKNKAY